MGDLFYTGLHGYGYWILWRISRPIILHRVRGAIPGGFILASTHMHPFDVPCLFYAARRKLDFMSTTDLFRKPFVAWLFKKMNTFALDRSRPDLTTVRTAIDRLAKGRVVTLFPEGRIQKGTDSVTQGGKIRPGVAGLAWLADAPVVPVVVLGTSAFSKWTSFFPIKRTRWGANFGSPIRPRRDLPEKEARARMIEELEEAYRSLYVELIAAMPTMSEKQKPVDHEEAATHANITPS